MALTDSAIRSAREAAGFSVAELADICNVSARAIEDFEAGRAKPDSIEADHLAAALAIPFEALLD